MYVRSLTGIGRRAALMATVGGLSLGSRCEGSVAASEEDLPRDPSLLPTVDDVVAGTIESQSPATVPAREGLGVGADANAEGDPWEGSYVKPALTVPEYLDEVRTPPREDSKKRIASPPQPDASQCARRGVCGQNTRV